MFLSSIDISFFTLPLVFQGMGWFFATGFFFYLTVFSLIASKCYIELKRFSTIAQGRERNYVGLMDLIEECCGPESVGIHSSMLMFVTKIYLKFVTVSTLVMLLASNQAFVAVVMQQIFVTYLDAGAIEMGEGSLGKWRSLIPILLFIWIFVPLVKHAKSSSFTLWTKAAVFVMLSSCSVIFCALASSRSKMNLPTFFPENWVDID